MVERERERDRGGEMAENRGKEWWRDGGKPRDGGVTEGSRGEGK